MGRQDSRRTIESLAPVGGVARRAGGVIVFGVATGILASLAAIGFVAAIQQLNDLLLISPRSRMMTADTTLLVIATLAVPTVGGLVVGLFNRYLIPGGRAHGPPHVIEAAQSGHGHVGFRGGLASAVAAILSLGSGASVGQYGPLVHLGGTLGSAIGRWTHGSTALGTVGIGCGVAAAIATAFNAPIAGILFAHEVILRHYSLKAFAPITVASTMGYFLATEVFELTPLFRIDQVPVVAAADFAAFIVIGVLGALVAVAFMKSVLLAGRVSGHLPLPDFVHPALAGLLLGVMALWVPEILGMGSETLRFAIIPEAFGPQELALILVAKIVATALCLGFGFAGGIFSPSLLIGVLFGAFAGYVLGPILPGDLQAVNIYAICGMAAVTSPVIGAPISTILIVFELTRNYDLTTAVMVSVVFSNLVAYRLFGRSMFDVQLRRRGFDLTFGRDKVVLDNTAIRDYIVDEYIALHPDTTCINARARIVAADKEEGHVSAADGRYLGTVNLSWLDAALDRGEGGSPIAGLVRTPGVVLRVDTSIWAAFSEIGAFNGHDVPVLAEGDGDRLVGVVPEPALIRAYLETVSDIRREEHASP